MLTIAVLALVAAQTTPPRQTVVRDSTRPDSAQSTRRRQPIRRPVTAELRASAFRDTVARDLVGRARAARIRQDSSILGYDARVAQRLSVKAAVGSVTLERLAYRQEATARVQWQRGVGAHIEVTGARVSIPALGMPKAERDALEDLADDPSVVPIPYFPGQEPLWVGLSAARPDVNERDLVNPLANGAEAYYTYSAGDVTTIRLPSRDSLVVRQIDVRPREAEPNVIIGSLWLDDASGQVVRAAYRLAAPGRGNVSIAPGDSGQNATTAKVASAVISALVPTMVAEVTGIVVEYQRVRGFWLPRSQVMEGFIKTSFARVPVVFENGFRFESVNETSGLAPITVDTLSTRTRRIDSVTVVSPVDQCKTAGSRVVTGYKADSVPVQLRVTCNLDSLARSPELPASAFDDGEEVFGTAARDDLLKQALSLADQSPFKWTPWRMPDLQYGVSFTRYNRIEGLSTGMLATQQMGAGFELQGLARIATADRRLRGELSIARTNASKTLRLAGYDRLVPMTDWESPLSFGSSLSAFLFGRDDAFYYRSTGGEVLWTSDRGLRLDWRAFHERQHTATPRTDFSVGGAFLPNLLAEPGRYSGAAVHWRGSRGLDPQGFRTSADVRLESAAVQDSGYIRASFEQTFLQGLGAFSGALTLGAGTSLGHLPVQRRWYLGGTQTVRGQGPSPALSGNAFWLSRAELGRPLGFMRVSVFRDLGWAGDRENFSEPGRPFSGTGLGFSFLDGAARLDVARGLYPFRQTRVSFYLGSRF